MPTLTACDRTRRAATASRIAWNRSLNASSHSVDSVADSTCGPSRQIMPRVLQPGSFVVVQMRVCLLTFEFLQVFPQLQWCPIGMEDREHLPLSTLVQHLQTGEIHGRTTVEPHECPPKPHNQDDEDESETTRSYPGNPRQRRRQGRETAIGRYCRNDRCILHVHTDNALLATVPVPELIATAPPNSTIPGIRPPPRFWPMYGAEAQFRATGVRRPSQSEVSPCCRVPYWKS